MEKRKLAQYILSKILEIYPDPKTELKNWKTPFQFLICIILSSQTTDLQVNKVTKSLFSQYPSSKELSRAKQKDIEKIVGSINYYKTKTRHIIALSKMIEKEFKGVVPKTQSKLLLLPGVGYKTAHVFLNDLYQLNEGIAVDTHVARVAQRMGLTKEKDPNKIAKDLEKLYPKRQWYLINSSFVLYGRYICKARMTKSDCILKDICSYCKNLSSA